MTLFIIFKKHKNAILKSITIKNYFKPKGLFFHLTGIRNAPLKRQLSNFSIEFSEHFSKGKSTTPPKDWFEAFHMLRKNIEHLPTHQKIILFFDELPWLASPRSEFMQALEHLWNRYLFDRPNLIFIVCGSAASWMIDNVINNKGGLHGRVTKHMRLSPFTLKETEQFLKAKGIKLDRKQIAELYLCWGGVAKYLTYIEKGKSIAQNIGKLSFSTNGPMISEFHKLYRSLFEHHEDHLRIVKTLASTRCGLTYKTLANKTGLSTGGTFSKRIEELTQSGFVAPITTFGRGSQSIKYLLIDEYSLFYLKWIANVSPFDLLGDNHDYWLKKRNSQSFRTWAGYAFESTCLKHIHAIKSALGLSAVHTTIANWQYNPNKNIQDKGTQIDLIIDRADQCINLIEIKFCQDLFTIDKSYAENLKYKRNCFERVTNTRKSTFITLITPYGVRKNSYYQTCIDNDLTINDLF